MTASTWAPPADSPPTADSGDQIVERAAAGARLLTVRGFGMRAVSVGSNLALIALVTPVDLGLLAVIRGITALAGNTTDLGFGWALLRRSRAPSREEYAALTGLQLALVVALLGLVLIWPGTLTAFGAVPPAWRTWTLVVLATALLVPFGTGAKIRIERELDYRKVAFHDVTSVLLINLVLLGSAIAKHFSLGVFLATGGSIVYSNLLLWFWAPGPPPTFRLAAWKALAREFAGFSAGHVSYVLYSSVTPIVVASLFGLATAGIWSFAVRLGNLLQVSFEGYRRAAVPAAALLTQSRENLRRLVEDSLLGAARLTVPLVAGLFAALPAIGHFWPKWRPAVPTAQLYILGFGLSGLLSASLVPAAVALRGARVVIGEQAVPIVVGWLGFLALSLLNLDAIAYVILPMHLALAIALWTLADPSVRPRWLPGLGRLGVALGVAVVITLIGQVTDTAPVGMAIAAAVGFAAIWWTGAGAGADSRLSLRSTDGG